jgi:hypothetical protein
MIENKGTVYGSDVSLKPSSLSLKEISYSKEDYTLKGNTLELNNFQSG